MADVPLLCYITIALEDKEYLEIEDILIIFGFFGMIAFGYVINLTTGLKYHAISISMYVCMYVCQSIYWSILSINLFLSINP